MKWLDAQVPVIEESVEGAKETAMAGAAAEAQARIEAVSAVLMKEVSPSIVEQGEGYTQKATQVSAGTGTNS